MIEIFAVRNVRVDLANCRKCVTRDIYISLLSIDDNDRESS